MGADVYPVFQPPVPTAVFDTDGKLLLSEHAALDSIALDCNLTPFSAFADNREVPDDFEGDPDELADVLGEWTEWFSIDDGLRTIDGLLAAIKARPEMAERLEYPEEVCADLEALASCLRVAREKNAQFRLNVA